MTSEIAIKNMHLSFVWFQPVLEHWRNKAALQPEMSFLEDIVSFANKFFSIKSAPTGGLSVPWASREGHHFWEHYLELAKYEEAGMRVYGRHLVPLRDTPGFSITADWFPGRLVPEVFYFPFGAAFILTAYYNKGPISFNDAVLLMHDLQHNKKLTLDLAGKSEGKLNDLAVDVLDSLVKHIFGKEVTSDIKANQPFSLFTVVQAKYDDPTPVADGGDIHKYLNALTEWSPSWETDGLPPLVNFSLHDKDWAPSHLIYTRSRGHADLVPAVLCAKI